MKSSPAIVRRKIPSSPPRRNRTWDGIVDEVVEEAERNVAVAQLEIEVDEAADDAERSSPDDTSAGCSDPWPDTDSECGDYTSNCPASPLSQGPGALLARSPRRTNTWSGSPPARRHSAGLGDSMVSMSGFLSCLSTQPVERRVPDALASVGPSAPCGVAALGARRLSEPATPPPPNASVLHSCSAAALGLMGPEVPYCVTPVASTPPPAAEPTLPPSPTSATGGGEWPTRAETSSRRRRGQRAKNAVTVSSQAAEGDKSITTVMIRNLPVSLRQRELVRDLDVLGFRGTYDFCYLPCDFSQRRGKGYAFVNFVLPGDAVKFRNAWHGSERYQSKEQDLAPVDVSAAHVQGLEANAALARAPHVSKIRNQNFRRLVKPSAGEAAKKEDADLPIAIATMPSAASGPILSTACPPAAPTPPSPGSAWAPPSPGGSILSTPGCVVFPSGNTMLAGNWTQAAGSCASSPPTPGAPQAAQQKRPLLSTSPQQQGAGGIAMFLPRQLDLSHMV